MPKILLQCSGCNHEYSVGDLVAPSKRPCPECGLKGNKAKKIITFGGGAMCFPCNKKFEATTVSCPDCGNKLAPQR